MLLHLTLAAAWVHSLDGWLMETETCPLSDLGCQQEQVRIAYGADNNDIVVAWATRKPLTDPQVVYGIARQDLNMTCQDLNLTCQDLNMTVKAESTKFVDGGPLQYTLWMYKAELKDLQANTQFAYKVGSGNYWSKLFTFRTPPIGQEWPLSAIVFGDLGATKGDSLDFIKNDVSMNKYNAIFHLGDIGYDLCDYNGRWGDHFMARIESLASAVPYMTCPGNHEYKYNYSHYKNRFPMPGAPEKMFYSFNLGPVHFVSINTEAYYNNARYPASETNVDLGEIITQYNWLREDLTEANKTENREKQPWIILMGHRPMYCSNQLRADQCYNHVFPHRQDHVHGRYGLEPLLMEFGVDLALWGHEHSYERTLPMYNLKVYSGQHQNPYENPRGPTHVTTGAAGCNEFPDLFSKYVQPWSTFRSVHRGYARLYVHNRTHLFMEQLSTEQDAKTSLEAQRVDSFWLIRDNHEPYTIVLSTPKEKALNKQASKKKKYLKVESRKTPTPRLPPFVIFNWKSFGNKHLPIVPVGTW